MIKGFQTANYNLRSQGNKHNNKESMGMFCNVSYLDLTVLTTRGFQ